MMLIQIRMLLVAALWSTSLAEKQECKLSTDRWLSDNEMLTKATSTMWDSFAKSCKSNNGCMLTQEPIAATTHLNYIPMKETENYIEARKACKELGTVDAPSSFCHVNSELHVTNGETGPKLVTDKFFARREPVCFPFQCATTQVELAHPKPLGCDPNTATCVIQSMDAECINRPEGAGTGNCNKYAEEFAQKNPYTDAVALLNTDVGTHCMDNLAQNDNSICVSTTEPIEITASQNFRKFERSDEYVSFKDSCYDADGELCFMSLTAKIEGDIIFFNIDLSGDYNDYPMCFPSDCQVEDRIQLHKETIGKDISQKVSHSIKYGTRRLSEDMIAAVNDGIKNRSLQKDEAYCPINGMDKCVILVADYYCTKREGSLIMQSNGPTSSTTALNPLSLVLSTLLAIVCGILP